MSAADVSAATTEAIANKASFLNALLAAWDHLASETDTKVAEVQVAHNVDAPSDLLPEIENLLARLDDVEALASGALDEIQASLAKGHGHGVG